MTDRDSSMAYSGLLIGRYLIFQMWSSRRVSFLWPEKLHRSFGTWHHDCPAEDVALIVRVMIRPEISKFVLFSFLNPINIPPVWLSLHPTALWNQANKCPILWQSAIWTSCETDFEYVDFELPETGKVQNLNNR